MPPSSTGTYSNFAPVRFSIAGIASWLRNALGLPKSNMNCGLGLTALSLGWFLYDPYHFNQPSESAHEDQPDFVSGFAMKRGNRESRGVVAHIGGPFGDQLFEPFGIAREQCADCFLEMRPVAGHGRHEAIGGFLREADAIAALIVAARLVDQFSDR